MVFILLSSVKIIKNLTSKYSFHCRRTFIIIPLRKLQYFFNMSIKATKSRKINHNVVDIIRRGRYATIEETCQKVTPNAEKVEDVAETVWFCFLKMLT
jgi:hypothetical protein